MSRARIYHPVLDRTIQVPESAVPIHRESGWVPADEYVPSPIDSQENLESVTENLADEKASMADATSEKKSTSKASARRQKPQE